MTMKCVYAASLLLLSSSEAFLAPSFGRPFKTARWVQGTSFADLLKTSDDDDDENDSNKIGAVPMDSWSKAKDYREAVTMKHADLYKELLDYDEVEEAQQTIAQLEQQIEEDTAEFQKLIDEEENLPDLVFKNTETVHAAEAPVEKDTTTSSSQANGFVMLRKDEAVTKDDNDNSVTLESFLESQNVPAVEDDEASSEPLSPAFSKKTTAEKQDDQLEAALEMTDLLFPALKKKKTSQEQNVATDQQEEQVQLETTEEKATGHVVEEGESLQDAALLGVSLEKKQELEIPKEGVQVEALDQLASQETPDKVATLKTVIVEEESLEDAALIGMSLEETQQQQELQIPKDGVQVEALDQLAATQELPAPNEEAPDKVATTIIGEEESLEDAALIGVSLEETKQGEELEIPKGVQVEALDHLADTQELHAPNEDLVVEATDKVESDNIVFEEESPEDAALIGKSLEEAQQEAELEIPKEGVQVEALEQLVSEEKALEGAADKEPISMETTVPEESQNAEVLLKIELMEQPAAVAEAEEPLVDLPELVEPTLEESVTLEDPVGSDTVSMLKQEESSTPLEKDVEENAAVTAELVMPEEKLPQAVMSSPAAPLVPLKRVTIREPFWVGTSHQEITSSLVGSFTPQESFEQLMEKDEADLFLRTGALLTKTALASGKAAIFAAQALGEAVSDEEVNEFAAELPTRKLEAAGAVCGAMAQCLRSSSSTQHALEAVSETSQGLVSAFVSAAAWGVKRAASAKTWFRRVNEELREREKILAEKRRVEAEKRRQQELLEQKRKEAERLVEEKRIAAEKVLEEQLEQEARAEQERREAERAALKAAALEKLRKDAEEEKKRAAASVSLESKKEPSKGSLLFFADEV